MIGEIVSKYRILSEIGHGGMGTVYKAQDIFLGRMAAVKLISESFSANAEAVARFEREGQAASDLMHPNICTVFETGYWQNRPFLVMEFLEGVVLSDRLKIGTLPIDDVLKIGIAVSSALEAAHSKKIIHRDIKPANLFLTNTGLLKVLDFGLAKRQMHFAGAAVSADATTASTFVTMPGTILGTLAYVAPEQVRGETVDGRADLYSLGVVLYETCTGKLPAFTSQAWIPEKLGAVLRKLIEPDRAARYQSARELRLALDEILRH
jgi:serine/threonine protein kinase